MTAFDPDFSERAALPLDRRRAWFGAAATIALASVVLVAVFSDLAIGAIVVWYNSPTYTHGFLIIPIVAYLVYERRRIFATLSPQPFLWGLTLMPLFGAVWLVAWFAGILEAQQFVFIGMVQGVLLTVLGWRAYRALLFPSLYLFFLVPSGEFLVPSLQDFTGRFAVRGLELAGIPVYADGTIIEIPNATFRVAEACAGLRFLIASIAFGFLFANLVYRSFTRRAVFLALSIIVPIIANGLRAFGIIMLAYLSDNRLAVGADHIVYGWGFFVAVTLLLIWIGLKFRDAPQADPPLPVPAAPKSPLRFALAGVLAVGLASVAPAYAAYLANQPVPAAPTAPVLPEKMGDWSRVALPPILRPSFTSADAELVAAYTKGDRRVDLYIAYYAYQRKGHELINYDNRIADEEIWGRIAVGSDRASVDARPLQVTATRLRSPQGQRLAWHWYWVDDQFTARTLEAKWLQVRAETMTRRRGAAVIVVSVDQAGHVEDDAEILRDFVQNLKSLRAIFPP